LALQQKLQWNSSAFAKPVILAPICSKKDQNQILYKLMPNMIKLVKKDIIKGSINCMWDGFLCI